MSNKTPAQKPADQNDTAADNDFAPDFEPQEHVSPDKTREHRDTGETDGDVDTDGG